MPERHPLPEPSTLSRHWSLDPEVVFLNHGSFGACPVAVLEEQQRWRRRMERQPLQFLGRDLEGLLDEVRGTLGRFVGAPADDLALVTNATSGVNSVLRSLELRAGDELLVTDHEYNACRNALNFAARRAGAEVVEVKGPFPLSGPGEVLERVLGAVTPRTRLVLFDHVTSPTGMVMPVEELVRELDRRGVDSLVDGAHAPGMLELDLEALGAAFYTGNCHKWLCAPKGAAFLYVRRDRQEELRPLCISHGANSPREDRSRFRLEFDWTGTCDPTPWLCIPAAIEHLGSLLPGGWPELRRRNHELAVAGRRILLEALEQPEPCPESRLGSMAAVCLPDGSERPPDSPFYADALQAELLERHAIEVPVIPWPARPRRLVRISAQLYNSEAQVEHLAGVLREILGGA